MNRIKAHMICHTHWDREWYLTRSQFLTKLVRLVDSVLDAVENSPDYFSFMLDGQTIVLEDYLEVRPQNRQRLANAIAGGKMFVGPWYILPDEILISGESHIRNYLTGQRVAEQFGGRMNIGYLPDSFGHPEQMPQILQGLSMDTTLFWRGAPQSMERTEFCWQAPYKGASVMGVHMPYGYGNSARLSDDLEETVPRLRQMMDQLNLRSHSSLVLLMNGTDHILNQKSIGSIIDGFNTLQGEGYQIQLSSMGAFLDELRPMLPQLDCYQGELRSGDQSMVLSGTMSTRVYLKQWNARIQRCMECYLEPMAALQRLLGTCGSFNDYQNLLWKKILENHPHDSICGCSVDEVHDEMMTRFHCVEQLQTTLCSDILDSVTGLCGTEAPAAGVQLLLWEPTQDGLPAYAEAVVDFDPMLVQRVNFAQSTIDEYEDGIDHPALPAGVEAVDGSGRSIPVRLLGAEKAYYMHLQDETAPEVYKVNRCKVALSLPSFAYGLHTVTLRPTAAAEAAKPTSGQEVENSYYLVRPDGQGSFSVLHKASGRTFTGVARLVDKGDAGDEYTYSWPREDAVYTLHPADCTLEKDGVAGMSQRLTLRGSLHLPQGLTADRTRRSHCLVDCPVAITAELFHNLDCISFTVEMDNRAKDHLLQLEIPTGVHAQTSSASAAFAVTQRPLDFDVPKSWMELPLPTYPTHGFVDIGNGDFGVSVACDGMAEYEAFNENGQSQLRISLLRCVGWLSRADLLTRRGNGGWVYETPGGQCLGRQTFRCGVVYHNGSWQQAGTLAVTQRMLHPPMLHPVPLVDKKLVVDNRLAFLSGLPRDVRLSACKLAEDGCGIVLRIYSVAEGAQEVSLPVGHSAVYGCNLAEEERIPLGVENGLLHITIQHGQIITLYLAE